MLITPLPGTDRQILLDALHELGMRVRNLRGGRHEAKFPGYIGWANNAARVLRHQIRATDIDRLVLTQRYWLLQSLNPVPNSNAFGSIIDLLETEIDERVAAFEEGSSALARQIERWSGPDVFVVADTSFYIQHTHPLDHLDLATLLATRHEPVRLLVPIIVIDELDGLKQHSNARARARKTLRTLDRVLEDPTRPAPLIGADWSTVDDGGLPRGPVTIEVVLDPIGHKRIPIADQELIDRAAAVEPLAARPVTFFTYDTGQAMRARAAGLKTIKLDQPAD